MYCTPSPILRELRDGLTGVWRSDAYSMRFMPAKSERRSCLALAPANRQTAGRSGDRAAASGLCSARQRAAQTTSLPLTLELIHG